MSIKEFFEEHPNVTSLVAEKAICRCEQDIYNTGDGWWHKDTGSVYCYERHLDINMDEAEPRMEPGK